MQDCVKVILNSGLILAKYDGQCTPILGKSPLALIGASVDSRTIPELTLIKVEFLHFAP